MKKVLLAIAIVASLAGCGLFSSDGSGPSGPANGASGPASTSPAVNNKMLAAGYVTVQTIAQSALMLAQSGKLTKKDVENIIATNQAAVVGLDAAREMIAAQDTQGAAAKLQQVTIGLTAIQTYLAARGAQK